MKHHFKSLLILAVLWKVIGLLHGQAVEMTEGTCPGSDGWFMFDGYCYLLSSTVANWRDSRDMCRQLAAELVSIHSQNEQNFTSSIMDELPDAIPYVWTGLHELDSGVWDKWTDGTNVTYFNWDEGEGDDITEQCMALIHLEGIRGLWYDHHCESNFLWMCKKHPDSNTTLTTPEPTVPQGYCPYFYHQYRDRCYNLGPGPLTWDEALDLCGSLHPDNMVSIRDQKEQAFLSSLLFNRDIPVWIGAKLSHEGEFWWSDNSPITYTNWYPGQPNGTKGTQYCAFMHADPHNIGFWEDDVCTKSYNYLCMTHVDSKNQKPPPVDPHNCTTYYTTWNNDCYRFLEYDLPVSWKDAEDECTENNGHLTSVLSRYEQAYIFSSLPLENKCVWIGIYSQDQLGLHTFLWADGAPTVYTQWAEGEPSILSGSACVCFDAITGDWYTKACDDTSITSAVCKISTGTATTTPIPQKAKCPTGAWILFGQHCYLVNTSQTNQTQAQMNCQAHAGADLASIHNEEENLLITAYIAAYGNSWIGLMKDEKGGFYWNDGSEAEIFAWDHNEPSDVNGTEGERCTAIDSVTGKWFDTTCGSRLSYICKTKSEAVSPSDELVGLAYGWQILIILSVVLILVTVVTIIIKCYKQPVAVSSHYAIHNEQFTAQSHRQDDPERAGYDQPESKK